MINNVLASMVPDYSGDGLVILESVPNLFNGGLWLGCAALLLLMVVVRKKLRKNRCTSESRRVD